MLQKLKKLLGINDDSKDEILQYEIDLVTDMVLNYCRINEIPDRLENVLLAMCMNYHRAVQAGNEDTPKSVSSVSEGDTSVSFASAYADEENPGMSFLANYTAQLNRFRKVGWQ